jgi:hypothetical protein
VPGPSKAATDPLAGNAIDSPAAPNPATPKTDKAFFDRFPLGAAFICDICGSIIYSELHISCAPKRVSFICGELVYALLLLFGI